MLGLDVEGVDAACAEAAAATGPRRGAANLNAPGQIVIAGHGDAVARALARTKGAKRVIALA